jgi:O-antigen biosynthesis protein
LISSGSFRVGRGGEISPSFSLEVAEGVELRNGATVAISDLPWFHLNLDVAQVAGRWVKLTYASGLLDPLARPVLRCFVGDAVRDEIMSGAIFGRSEWLGRIPNDVTAIWISPTNQAGPFAFAIETLKIVSRLRLLWDIVRRDPTRAWVCFWARSVGLRDLAQLQVKRALRATPIEKYDGWRIRRLRAYDPIGFDRGIDRSRRDPHIRILVRLDGSSEASIQRLVAQMAAQPYPNWSVAVAGDSFDRLRSDAVAVAASGPNSTHDKLLDGDLIAELSPDDLMPDFALAAIARAAQDHPHADAFYGDEDFVDGHGKRVSPRFKAEWSAIFPLERGGGGAFLAVRVSALKRETATSRANASAGGDDLSLRNFSSDQFATRHIRRVLRTQPVSRILNEASPVARSTANPDRTAVNPRATIVIATRDRLDLLARCVQGLQSGTRLAGAEIIVVDNGSVRDETKTFLANLAMDDRFRVISTPGAFNFSRLCNEAAAQARASVLVFLNNDIEIVDPGWLDELLAFATRPQIGAVGAKLFYPNGRLQHAGVIVGIDGRAGHFERGLGPDEPGYFGRLNVPHEVSAVTAACLAVEAKKFFAIGGFDEINLPVELNDVDLCLRLVERGWKTVYAPSARLVHRESASRGSNGRLDARYQEQHAYFCTRWSKFIRDDPAFHPALSLDSLRATLG